MKHTPFLLATVLVSTAAPLLAMDNCPPPLPHGDEIHLAKRQRISEAPLLAKGPAQFLLLACKGGCYDLEREEQAARATVSETAEQMMKDGTFDCLCGSRFNRTDHGIILLPCGRHRICEMCALELLRPNKRRPATPQPCPICRHEPNDKEAIVPLLDIALRRASRGDLAVPLGQIQRLHTTRSAYDGHDIDADSEDTQGEDLGDTDGEEEEEKEREDSSGYESSFINDDDLEEDNPEE